MHITLQVDCGSELVDLYSVVGMFVGCGEYWEMESGEHCGANVTSYS